jgi:hypothetical protein
MEEMMKGEGMNEVRGGSWKERKKNQEDKVSKEGKKQTNEE